MVFQGFYHDISPKLFTNVDFILDISLQSIHWRCLSYLVQIFWPQWPNGQGTGLRSQGLWVRVPSGVIALYNCDEGFNAFHLVNGLNSQPS